MFGVHILQVPMRFVLRALRQVLFQKACEIFNDGGRLMPLYFKTTLGLFALALLPALLLIIWSPQLFTLVFGSQWHVSGEFARILVIWLVFMFCNLPSEIFAKIIRMQRKLFLFNLVIVVARTLVLILGGILMSAFYTVVLFSVVGALINIIFIVVIGIALSKKEGHGDTKFTPNSLMEG